VDRIRVVMAKPGLDSHYRGALVVSRYLTAAGMEVVYAGNQLPEQLVNVVLHEDADVVGLSCLSGNHLAMVPPVLDGLRTLGLGHVVVLVGGIIPAAHVPFLLDRGVAAVFGPGSELAAIARCVTERVEAARRADPVAVAR
jgi:methylmalonyl-CoA mutase, C-terminal domain